jgi:phosphoribosylformylglycinamidine cyclo-ligase
VGVVERLKIIDGSMVKVGDRVWGLPSTGLHTNGYTLARQIVAGLDLRKDPGGLGQSLGEALLAPHPSYLAAIQPMLGEITAIAHVTGGGIPGNLPRVLPEAVSVEIDWGSWRVPPIFDVLQKRGGVAPDEMLRVFNMGLGLIFVTDPLANCPGAVEIGRVVPRRPERVAIVR